MPERRPARSDWVCDGIKGKSQVCENLRDLSIASNVCGSTELMMATSDTGIDTAVEIIPWGM
jgi:hypothetical protein